MRALRDALGWDSLPSAGQSVAVLIRHAERPPIPLEDPGNHLPLTNRGRQQAEALGLSLGAAIKSISTSPVRRCIETAEGIRRDSGLPLQIVLDSMLGDPGVYTADPELAWKTWCEWGQERVYRELLEGVDVPPGMEDPFQASRNLARHMLSRIEYDPGVHVYITHDLLIATLAARSFRTTFDETTWPQFLTGLSMWPEKGGVRFTYGGRECRVDLAAHQQQ